MLVAGLVLTALAAVFHGVIFYLESIAWTTPRARSVFGIGSVEEAETTRPLAFNQGFYNLFLGIIVLIGILLVIAGRSGAGMALCLAGTGSMAAAALVLFVSSPRLRNSALKQGVLPLLAVFALIIALVV